MSPFDLEGLRNKLAELASKTEDPNFWSDQETAQKVLKEKKSIENTVSEYDRLLKGLEEVPDLIEIAEELDDEDEADGILDSYSKLCQSVESFRLTALLDGKYDHNSAILSVHAGAGGVEAMDWAQMLHVPAGGEHGPAAAGQKRRRTYYID